MTKADLKKAPPHIVRYRAIDREPVIDGTSDRDGRFTVAELLSPGWLTKEKFGSRIEVGEILVVAGSDGDVQARVTGVDPSGCFIIRPFMAAPVAGPHPDHEPAETPAARPSKRAA